MFKAGSTVELPPYAYDMRPEVYAFRPPRVSWPAASGRSI